MPVMIFKSSLGGYSVADPTDWDIWLDTNASTNGSGTSVLSPFNNWNSAAAAMSAGKKLGIKRGSEFNQVTNIGGSSWNNARIGCYGDVGALPTFRYSTFYNSFTTIGTNQYRVTRAALNKSTSYASGGNQVYRATAMVIDGRFVYQHVTSTGAMNAVQGFFHNIWWNSGTNQWNGDQLNFYNPGVPTTVELPISDGSSRGPFTISNCTGVIIQDLRIASSRDHGMIVASCNNITIRRCVYNNCGLWGIYMTLPYGAAYSNITVENCTAQWCHCGLLGLTTSQSGGTFIGKITNLLVQYNTILDCQLGTPWDAALTADDYWSGAIKLFGSLIGDSAWTGYVQYNYVDSQGTRDRDVKGVQGGGIYLDTVAGSITVRYNDIRNCRTFGIGVEMSPASHIVEYNSIYFCGQNNEGIAAPDGGYYGTGYSGGVCIFRGNTGCIVRHNSIDFCKFGAYVIAGINSNDGFTGSTGGVTQRVSNNQFNDNACTKYTTGGVLRINPASGTNNTLNNNCFNNATNYEYHATASYTYTNYNWAGFTAAYPNDSNTKLVSVMFTAPPTDYTLQGESPLRTAPNLASDGTFIGRIQV